MDILYVDVTELFSEGLRNRLRVLVFQLQFLVVGSTLVFGPRWDQLRHPFENLTFSPVLPFLKQVGVHGHEDVVLELLLVLPAAISDFLLFLLVFRGRESLKGLGDVWNWIGEKRGLWRGTHGLIG